jgi:hypothetical protein
MEPADRMHPGPGALEQRVIDGHDHRLPGRDQQPHHQPRQRQPKILAVPRAWGKNRCARSCGHTRDSPAPVSMPHTVRLPVGAKNPAASAQNMRNDGTVNNGSKQASNAISGGGKARSGSISVTLFARRLDQR